MQMFLILFYYSYLVWHLSELGFKSCENNFSFLLTSVYPASVYLCLSGLNTSPNINGRARSKSSEK